MHGKALRIGQRGMVASGSRTLPLMSCARTALGAAALALASGLHAGDLFLPAGATGAPGAPAAKSAAGDNAWKRHVRIARHELDAARDRAEGPGEGRLLLNVRDGVRLDVAVERTAPTKWGYSLSGRVAGGGYVTLVAHDEVVAGTIWTPDASYELMPAGGGVHALRDVTNEPPIECGGILQPELDSSDDAAHGVDAGDVSVVDILVVYTPAAEEEVARERSLTPADARLWIAAFNDLGIAIANDAFERGGAFVSLNLVGFEKVEYESPTRGEGSGVLGSDEVKALRDSLGADLVHATVGCCYGAAIGGGRSYLTAGSSVVFIAHEIGHSFSIGHERSEALGSWAPYQHGFTSGSCEITIMSYGTDCFRYVRASPPAFASPWRYDRGSGRAMGVSRFSKDRGSRGPADAILTLNRNRHRVANYRPSRNGGGG